MKTLTKAGSDELMLGPKQVSSDTSVFTRNKISQGPSASRAKKSFLLFSYTGDPNFSPSASGMKSNTNPSLLDIPLG